MHVAAPCRNIRWHSSPGGSIISPKSLARKYHLCTALSPSLILCEKPWESAPSSLEAPAKYCADTSTSCIRDGLVDIVESFVLFSCRRLLEAMFNEQLWPKESLTTSCRGEMCSASIGAKKAADYRKSPTKVPRWLGICQG